MHDQQVQLSNDLTTQLVLISVSDCLLKHPQPSDWPAWWPHAAVHVQGLISFFTHKYQHGCIYYLVVHHGSGR